MTVSGFSLVELLITMAIAVLILLVSTQFLHSTNSVSSNSVSRSAGINHVQQAANIVADDVRRALFIVAPATAPYLGTAVTGAPTTTGTSMLALYTGKTTGSRCSTDYEYNVYYFVARSAASASTVSEWSSVTPDPANTAQKVLMQFSACVTFPDPTKAVPSDELVRVITDYIGVGSFDYTPSVTGKFRRVTLNLTATQVVLGATTTGAPIVTVATARNIF